ncbi:MAG: glycosyltransferase family 4 protein [Planctomycetaceae bacterium]
MSSRRLTIVQVVPELNSGGVERGTLEVGGAIAARGYRSIVVSGGGRMVTQLEQAGIEHITLPVGKKSPATLRWTWALRDLFQSIQADIVHARSRIPAWLCRAALATLPAAQRPRFVTTCHGLYSVGRYSSVMVSGERVIAISKTVQRYIEENYPHVDRSRLRLIYRGVAPQEFPRGYRPSIEWIARWRQEFPQTVGRPLVMLPGRITRYKGHHTFIELMDRLRKLAPDAMGLIVGGEDPRRTEYAASVRQAVNERGLKNVVFTGHRSDIRDVMAISTLVLSVSAQPPEAFGRTTLEALALGTPVIGFDDSGVGEILADMLPEGAVPHGDVDVLTHRTISFLNHSPAIRPNTTFTLQRMLDQTLDVYHEVMGSLGRKTRAA